MRTHDWWMQPAFQRANYGANSYPTPLPQSSVTTRFAQTEAPELAQLQDDPICASSGCAQYLAPPPPPTHPMDYFVPNFGMDKDIKSTLENEKVASALVGHGWEFNTVMSKEKNINFFDRVMK